jgi:hypothetical protein
MIEVFSSWFLVNGYDHRHFHIRSVIGIILYGYFLDREHRGNYNVGIARVVVADSRMVGPNC